MVFGLWRRAGVAQRECRLSRAWRTEFAENYSATPGGELQEFLSLNETDYHKLKSSPNGFGDGLRVLPKVLDCDNHNPPSLNFVKQPEHRFPMRVLRSTATCERGAISGKLRIKPSFTSSEWRNLSPPFVSSRAAYISSISTSAPDRMMTSIIASCEGECSQ